MTDEQWPKFITEKAMEVEQVFIRTKNLNEVFMAGLAQDLPLMNLLDKTSIGSIIAKISFGMAKQEKLLEETQTKNILSKV